MSVAFLFEHPNWSEKLISVLSQRIAGLEKINVGELVFDTSLSSPAFTAAINRINIMPSADRSGSVVFQTLHYLQWLEVTGVRVLNGAKAHSVGSSKALQNGVFASLGLDHPKGIAIYRQQDALQAAQQIGYPVIVKPNIGGSGSGVSLFNDAPELENAVRVKSLDLGVDRTGIVQQYIQSDGFVYRVEVLADELFYSIKQPIVAGEFNYCAADGCSTETTNAVEADDFDFCAVGGSGIQQHQPPGDVIQNVISIVKSCAADFGGVEYFLNSATGQPCYYDFNPYSNFVSDGESLLGFSPEERFCEFTIQKLGLATTQET
ncbi:MAG: hypothetical protein AAF402_05400 [Pseudomonadota bacterium]